MCRFSKWEILLIALVATGAAAESYQGIGRPATADEIKAWDIDVRPDFKGLPTGSGTVERGMDLFEEKCASCHGTFGESNEVFTPLIGGTTTDDVKIGRVQALSTGDLPQRTTFTKVSTISTLFDYIQRAMPWTTPKSLKPDEVYAILAYMLNLADIVPADFTLSDKNIASVQKLMPNRNGMTTDHGLWPGSPATKDRINGVGNGGKADVANTLCMKNCKREVLIGSTLPGYARTAHGNLAEQYRSFGPVRGTRTVAGEVANEHVEVTKPLPIAREVANKNGCLACHSVTSKIVGPSFREVFRRYKDTTNGEVRLLSKIKQGGQGIWGTTPMPPNPQLTDEALKILVRWILTGAE